MNSQQNKGKINKNQKNNQQIRDIEEYLKKAKLIIKKLEERKKINKEFLSEIEVFIKHAQSQIKNKNLNREIKFNYLVLIEEEENMHKKIKNDIKGNNKLIESIKKSMDTILLNEKF